MRLQFSDQEWLREIHVYAKGRLDKCQIKAKNVFLVVFGRGMKSKIPEPFITLKSVEIWGKCIV